MKKKRITLRDKRIASLARPTYGEYATKEEVKKVKAKVRGHFWHDDDMAKGWDPQYVSYSPSGHRRYYEYNLYSWMTKESFAIYKMLSKKAARLWALGKKKQSEQAERDMWNIEEVRVVMDASAPAKKKVNWEMFGK
jgi:hypothetical protein